jgi:hypothetical protein
VDGVARFWFPDVGGFAVEAGKRITAYPKPGIGDDYLRLYVEGMLMAMLLHQRGFCVLHASVVEIAGRSVALMGHVGVGKSSLAAGLYARGHRVLADDNAAIQLSNGTPAVAPGYPYVKLFPAIAALLGFDPGSLRLLHESQKKMAGGVSGGFDPSPAALSRIYVLRRDHASGITPLSALEATVELVRNAVPTRWGHPGDGDQLRRCADLAKQVPTFAVRTFSDLAVLPAVIEDLERHSSQGMVSTTLSNARRKEVWNGS